jgi:Cu(I)/Ag(I) efflux system membrane fusion protein
MSRNENSRRDGNLENEFPPDEGGLSAPAHLGFWGKAWWWFDFLILVKLARLRFIGLLLVIGLIILKWDLITAYYERWTRPTEHAHGVSDFEYYCPMHPTVIRDNAKDKCPICFMPLSKRRKGDNTEEALPPGVVNRVQLTPYRVVLAGIKTWDVKYLPLTKEITTVGFVDFDERKMKHVAARVKGRIDTLFVNETGRMVHENEELASLYSPDLVTTVENLLDAKKNGSVELQRYAIKRLDLWGISKDQIDEILKTGKANSHLKIRSPIEGHVLRKYVKEGQYVDEGSPLYDIVDLSTVWIQAQVYEEDMAFLPYYHNPLEKKEAAKIGMPVTATTRGLPGRTFDGKLTFIFPHVDQDTRTVMVRFELDNPNHVLRPGATATVTLKIPPSKVDTFGKALDDDWRWRTATDTALRTVISPLGSGGVSGIGPLLEAAGHRVTLQAGLLMAVPESAVINTGKLQLVYRELMPGEYEGVKVELGPRMVDSKGATYFPVLRGLEVGDKIVAAGSFLVDAETRLNPAAGSIYFGGSGSKGQGGVTVRPSTPDDEDAKIAATLAKLSIADRSLAEEQRFCPILKDTRLGSMGVPVKITVENQPVFLCCKSCDRAAFANPKETIAKVEQLRKAPRR